MNDSAQATVVVLATLAAIAAIITIAVYTAPKCPCSKWRYSPARLETVPVIDGEGGVHLEIRHIRERWVCIERYQELPEGGCGVREDNGFRVVTEDVTKTKEAK